MSRSGMMLLVGCLVLFFGIFFGVELAQRGLERVHGPLAAEPRGTAASVSAGAPSGKTVPAGISVKPEAGKAGSASWPAAAGTVNPGVSASSPPTSIVPSAAQGAPAASTGSAVPPPASDSLVNRVGNNTGDMLQLLAHYGIDAVVSLLDGIFK